MTGKVIEFEVKSKSCKVCELAAAKNEIVKEHDCVKNWTGSAKAMEPAMACDMIKRIIETGKEVRIKYQNFDKPCIHAP